MNTSERIFYVAIILVMILLSLRSCPSPVPQPANAPTVIRDTIYAPSTDSVTKRAIQPQAIVPTKTKSIAPKTITIHDTVYTINPADTAAILRDCLASYIYSDTVNHVYGSIVITDTISRNMIEGRKVVTHLVIPTVKETVLVPEIPHGRLYAGVGLMGNPVNPITQIGPELTWKSKTEKMYSAGLYIGQSGGLTYKAGIHFPIK